MRALQVDGRSVIGGRFVHGDPEANAIVGRDWSVLIVLMPFEALVGIDHEQVGTDANLVRFAALRENVSDGRVVVKIGKGAIRLPNVALDVVVQFRGGSGKGPKVGILHLVGSGRPQVFDPLGVEYTSHEYHAILLQGLQVLLGNSKSLGGSNIGNNSVGQRNLWIL